MFKWKLMIVLSAALLIPGTIASSAYEYPGAGEQITIDLASALIETGVQGYYKAYGIWPQTWLDVVQADIVQVSLISPTGEVINPDDGELDFVGDKQLIPGTEGSAPRIVQLIDVNGQHLDVQEIPECPTYVEMFAQFDKQHYYSVQEDSARLCQFALAGACARMLTLHYWVVGEYPSTWAEFLSSGFAPVDSNSINPVTQSAISGDGGVNDFRYEYVEGVNIATVIPVGNAVDQFWQFSF
jgi:hypothetical protein